MTTLLLLVVKASLVLAAALAVTPLLRRQSVALRHWVLVVGLFCAAAMPALEWLAPTWTLPDVWPGSFAVSSPATTLATSAATVTDVNSASMLPQPTASLPISVTARVSGSVSAFVSASVSPFLATWLLGVWLSGAVLALVVLVAGLWRMQRVVKRTVPLTEPRLMELAHRISFQLRTGPVTLVEGSDPALLVTCGWWRPTIVLPPDCHQWPEDKLRSVLSHELAHVRRRDWLVQLGAEVARCVYWFNPLFWLAARRLRQESERACDDVVLYEGVDAASYASHLLDIARVASRSRALPLALGMASSTSFEGRVKAMFGERIDRRPVTSRAAFTAALLMLAVALPIAATTLDRSEQRLPEPLPSFPIVAPSVLVSPPATLTPSIAIPAPLPRRPSARRTESTSRATPSAAANADQAPASKTASRFVVHQQIPAAGSAIFSGIVRGPAGAPMAGVTVVMTDVATGAVRTEKTATDGRFAFFAVPAASYSVTASNPGWATVRYNVTLEDGRQADREFVLKIGAVSEAVTVAASGVRGATAPGPGVTPPAQVSNVVPPLPTRLCDANGRNCLTTPVKIVHVTPVYPPEALARGVQGVVILEGAIMPSGEMSDPRVLRGVDPALNDAAVEAVKQWVFTPTLLDGMATAVIMSITVNFTIP